MEQQEGRSWVNIDLPTLLNNIKCYNAGNLSNIMAVVKADAYGHGDQIVAKYLSKNGICHFAVSNIDEALHIRNAGIDGEILILGYTPIERAADLYENNITQTLLSREYADMLFNTGYHIKCQFAIDTGMRRIGLNADNIDECEQTIRMYSKKLNINGVFTHLCVADSTEQDDFTKQQISLFEKIVDAVADLNLTYCHCMNSAGGIWYQSHKSVLIRLGIIMYGLKPDYANILPNGIEPVLSWKTVVSMVKNVKPGDTIGYGRSFLVKHPMQIATLPTGYADGYSRLLSNKGWVLINGCKAPIVGRVCMDQMMVDVTNIPNVHMGEQVTLIGKDGNEIITADDLANLYGTIGYEVVCGINKRVDRIYNS